MYAYAYICIYAYVHLCDCIALILHKHVFRIPLGGPETLLVNLVPEVDWSVPPTAEVLKLQNHCNHTFKCWSLWMPFFLTQIQTLQEDLHTRIHKYVC